MVKLSINMIINTVKIITYLYNSQEPSIIQEFYYNEKGSVIKEKTKDYRTNEKNINKYFYKYEFY